MYSTVHLKENSDVLWLSWWDSAYLNLKIVDGKHVFSNIELSQFRTMNIVLSSARIQGLYSLKDMVQFQKHY